MMGNKEACAADSQTGGHPQADGKIRKLWKEAAG